MTLRTLLPFATSGFGPFYGLDRDFARVFQGCAAPGQTGLAPRIDLTESQDGFIIVAELPGLDAQDINIDVVDNLVTLSGEKKAVAQPADGIKQHFAERSFGAFRRSFALPVDIDADKVAANFKNGLLTIALPRHAVEQPKAKKIAVQTV